MKRKKVEGYKRKERKNQSVKYMGRVYCGQAIGTNKHFTALFRAAIALVATCVQIRAP
jgi:hypothetical protein